MKNEMTSLTQAFEARLLEGALPGELEGFDEAERGDAARFVIEAAAKRPPATPMIRLETYLDEEQRRMRLAVVNDDMPFLVDSIASAITAEDIAVHRIIHPVIQVNRDGDGQLLPEEQVDPGIDVVWGGGDYTFERDFKPFLKPLALSPALLTQVFPSPDLAGVALLDPASHGGAAPRWVGVVLSSFGLIYAPEFYERMQLPAPESWSDLARPELKGLLALADPTRSGSAAVAYMMVLQRAMESAEQSWLAAHPEQGAEARPEHEQLPSYRDALAAGWKEGMRTLLLMAANARYFGDSGSRPCVDVGDAEAAAAMEAASARLLQSQKLESLGAKPVQAAPEPTPEAVTQPAEATDTPPTEEEAVKAVEEVLGATVIAEEVNPDAKCQVCGGALDDLDLAELGKKRFGKLLCVTDYLAELKN